MEFIQEKGTGLAIGVTVNFTHKELCEIREWVTLEEAIALQAYSHSEDVAGKLTYYALVAAIIERKNYMTQGKGGDNVVPFFKGAK